MNRVVQAEDKKSNMHIIKKKLRKISEISKMINNTNEELSL